MEEKKLYNAVRKTITLADGREIMIETGKLAKQADGLRRGEDGRYDAPGNGGSRQGRETRH